MSSISKLAAQLGLTVLVTAVAGALFVATADFATRGLIL